MSSIKTLNILLVAALVLGVFLYFDSCRKRKQDNKDNISLVNALSDTLKIYKKKDSTNVATISVLETGSARDFLKIKSGDSEITELQKLVKEYSKKLSEGSSVTKAKVETVIEQSKPTIVVRRDTMWVDSVAYVYPTYRDTIKNKWIDYTAIMNKDSSNISFKVTNDFSVIVGKHKGKAFVDLNTDNPYSSTKSLRTYQVKMPREKRFGIGPNVSYGFDQDFKKKFFIGVGIQYNLLRL